MGDADLPDVRRTTPIRIIILRLLFCIAPLLLAGPTSIVASSPEGGFRAASPGYQYRFPRDHGSHDEFRTEWWYYTGHLTAKNGRRLGFQLTFFRRAIPHEQITTLPSRWAIKQLYLAHVALSDLDHTQFRFAEKISREGLGKAGAGTDHLRVWIDRWSADMVPGASSRQRLLAATKEFSLDLWVEPAKPLVIHGVEGLSRKGTAPGQVSHYYSMTRLTTEGTVSIGNEQMDVSGVSWMDHEFGSADLDEHTVGWDWFSIQLSNQRELMFYQLRRSDGSADPASNGTLVDENGRTRSLTATDLVVEPLAFWTSPTSGARYPAHWRLSVPSLDLSLEITVLLADQELITRRSTQVTYWEGAVHVSGRVRGQSVSGQGYVELTGYAERFTQRL